MASAPLPVEATGPANDVRPLVARRVTNRGAWLFAGVLALAGIGLFATLEARREARQAPGMFETGGKSAVAIAPPPALAIPQPYPESYGAYGNALPGAYGPGGTIPPAIAPAPPAGGRAAPIPKSPGVPAPAYYDPNSPDPMYVPNAAAPALAVPAADDTPAPAASGTATTPSLAGGRVSATRLANPALTVPQGTVILAVLETALDSTRPGFVRAVVSRDVRSFDGTRVLIPRGSRLFGEYKADMASGQKRAFVLWEKLTRPDGAQITLNSPAADPLGRSGIGGKVNSHFFERFAGAMLQSALDIGVGLATRSATNGTLVLGLPGSTTQINPAGTESIRLTLKVKQGSSVSVFVARDLDFSTVE